MQGSFLVSTLRTHALDVMSLEAAKKWFYLIHDPDNKALFDELQAIEGADARIAFAKTKGYEFTLEEFQQEASNAWDNAVGELSDEQLENVAGGAATNPFGPGGGAVACYASPGTYANWQNLFRRS